MLQRSLTKSTWNSGVDTTCFLHVVFSIFLFMSTLLEPLRSTDGRISLPWLCLHYDTPFRHTPTQQVSSVRSLYSLSVTRSHHRPPGAGSLFSHLLPSSINDCPSGCQSVLWRSSLSFLTWNFSFCLCSVFPKSFLISLCAVPIQLMSVHHPIPSSFTIQRGNWITRV